MLLCELALEAIAQEIGKYLDFRRKMSSYRIENNVRFEYDWVSLKPEIGITGGSKGSLT